MVLRFSGHNKSVWGFISQPSCSWLYRQMYLHYCSVLCYEHKVRSILLGARIKVFAVISPTSTAVSISTAGYTTNVCCMHDFMLLVLVFR